jgi:hypothetical protein
MGSRIALVIGNDSYLNVVALERAGSDANSMARELGKAGFEVMLHRNLNYRSMVKAIDALKSKINGGDQVVVFFAGHGVQIRAGSYLLPVDIEIASETIVEKTAYSLNDLTEMLSAAKSSFALVIVDACRDNPLKLNGRSIGGAGGLNAIEPPKGQMVVYSASRGQQALDKLDSKDLNPNGVFTREFVSRMNRSGLRIDDLVHEVQDAVETLARTVNHEQRPAVYSEARGSFYFFPPTSIQIRQQKQLPPAEKATEKIENVNWEIMKNDSIPSHSVPSKINQYPQTSEPVVKSNAMSAALLSIEKTPQRFQIHVYDLIMGDVYSDIKSINVNKSNWATTIGFSYRGNTNVSFQPDFEGSPLVVGSYRVNIPLRGATVVKVSLTFDRDGTARGEWRNMGFSGTFDITKKY